MGLLLAALYRPVFTSAVNGIADLIVALAGFGALRSTRRSGLSSPAAWSPGSSFSDDRPRRRAFMATVERRSRAGSVAALLAALALAAAGCGGSSENTATAAEQTETTASVGATLLSPAEAEALIETGDVEILDVRTPEEYAEGHVQDAMLVDFYEPDFAARIGELDRDREYVVYCRSGNRSGQAVALMVEQGFGAVNDVDGGILAWEAAGLPVVR